MMTGFPYLKRDLVKLLGILCHDSKPIQDRIRCCGGIPIVLNLCVIDERNPCKSFFFLFLVGELRDCVARTTTRPGERNRRARISASFRSHKPIRNALRSHHGEEGQLIVTYITDLREHAVFALRNILRDSPENQAVVDSFRADEHVVGGTTVM